MEFQGLNNIQVEESRKKHGMNILHKNLPAGIKILRKLLGEPMLIILLLASLIYFFTGQLTEGIFMALAIILVSGISVFQEYRSSRAIGEIKKLTKAEISVFRNSKIDKIPSEDLVVGDIVQLSEGELIPADLMIIKAADCSVDESILSGESLPVAKSASDSLYAGTNIFSGMAYAEVKQIGLATKLGLLGKSMDEVEGGKSPLQYQIGRFVKYLSIFGLIAFLFVWYHNYKISGDYIFGFMRGLTLAMAVLPEEIPVALSTFMALGAFRMLKHNVLVKKAQAVETLGASTVICLDKTGTITENRMRLSQVLTVEEKEVKNFNPDLESVALHDLILYAMLASEPIPFDPMEKAIHAAYRKLNSGPAVESFNMLHEYPLGGKFPMMTHIHKSGQGEIFIACKGAPEGILNLCIKDNEEKKSFLRSVDQMTSEGSRVLAVAKSVKQKNEWPVDQHDFNWELLGLIALNDPPKEYIRDTIHKFQDAGIRVKMITGDYPGTAAAIGKQIGLINTEKFLTGEEVRMMTEIELKDTSGTIDVYARMLPEDKLKLIQALKDKGEVVAMTGDGVNDGPALKAANIGVAMGLRGSDIARQAASIILLDDNLSSMTKAVELGRRIFSNLQRAIGYIVSIHIPLISMVTLPLLLGWKYPHLFNPVHIIFLELVMGPTCSIVFENEPAEKSTVTRANRLKSGFPGMIRLGISALRGLVITVALLLILHSGISQGFSEDECRTLVFTGMVFSNIFLTLSVRSDVHSIFSSLKKKNFLVPLIILITSSVWIFTLLSPAMKELFQFELPEPGTIIGAIGISIVSVIWIDFFKVFRKEK